MSLNNNILIPCKACGKEAIHDNIWLKPDNLGNYAPPADLKGCYVCKDCWAYGKSTLEMRIRVYQSPINVGRFPKHITLDSLAVDTINSNIRNLFPDLPRVNMNDGTDGLNCVSCNEYFSYVVSNCSSGYKCGRCRE